MKKILLCLFAVGVLFHTGCASRPSIDEQSRQDQEQEQTMKKSDTFAHDLPQ